MESVMAVLLDHLCKAVVLPHGKKTWYTGLEVLFHLLLSSVLYGDKSQTSHASCFIPGIDGPLAIEWEAVWACINKWGI
jgi:hypothetical protein